MTRLRRALLSILFVIGNVSPIPAWTVAPVQATPSAAVAAAGAQPAGSVEIAITDAGLQPSTVAVPTGGSIHWTNRSQATHDITGPDGLFASGALPPGAGFSIALGIAGSYPFTSTVGSQAGFFYGVIDVGQPGLPGAAGDLVASAIPDLPFPPAYASSIGIHPLYGVTASRTRILLKFVSGTQVGPANALLQSAGVVVIGGMPWPGMLLVEAPDTPDFAGLLAALSVLRGSPVVQYAAMSFEETPAVVPPPPEKDVHDRGWYWDVTPAPSGAPGGFGLNWGIEASRVPQAWNLLETIRRRQPEVKTGIVDDGFEAHEDIPVIGPTNPYGREVVKVVDLPRFSWNSPHAHGNHTSGIIMAGYDNAAPQAGAPWVWPA